MDREDLKRIISGLSIVALAAGAGLSTGAIASANQIAQSG